LHKGYFTQKPLALAAAKALQKEGVKTNGYNARQLLESYRKIEYGGGND
jgi:hypothetical protein